MSDTVQQIKDRLSIVDVVSQYVKLERTGGSLKARCPFHAERSPSFHVSPERGTYHCFGCHVGGDIFSFVQAIEGLDFKGALRVLAEKAGVEITYERGVQKDARDRLFEMLEAATIYYSSKLDDGAKKYLHDRGLSDATITQFRIGVAGDAWSACAEYLRSKGFTEAEIVEGGIGKKSERGTLVDKFRNRILFPIADSAGRIVGFSGRTYGEHASPDAPKYLNSPETPLFHKSRILYGFDTAKHAMRRHNFAVLVEGQMDLLMSHEAGWGNTVAASGTAFTREHAALIKRMTENLVLALDGDQAGIKAAGKAAREALRSGLQVKVAQLPAGLDPADLIKTQGNEAWKTAIRDSKDIFTFLLDVLQEYAKSPDSFRRSVETIVLPFLSDVQSPIAREQTVRLIAHRLGVSEQAVIAAYEGTPKEPTPDSGAQTRSSEPPATYDRVRQAYALLLWQRSVPTPRIDVEAFEKRLLDIIGEENVRSLETTHANDSESLRFSAEILFGNSPALDRTVEDLLMMLKRERLRSEMQKTSQQLQAAEIAGNEKEVSRLMDVARSLNAELARIS